MKLNYMEFYSEVYKKKERAFHCDRFNSSGKSEEFLSRRNSELLVFQE